MSEPKWTPGPWTAERGNIGSAHPLFVVAPHMDGLKPWTDADAHLIAAAPELYETLERIVKWMDIQGYNALYQDDTAIKDARAALAKARGETQGGSQ